MLHSEGTLTGFGGLSLYYQSWCPDEETRAVVGMVHGLGNHSGWFRSMAEALVDQGFAVYGMDLRGHGRSPGQRAYINRWAELREDFAGFRQLMASQHPGLPCFALGHSLGGIILLDAVLRGQALSGLMMMAPSLNPTGVPVWRLAIGQVLSLVYPRFSLDTGIPHTVGSRDGAIVAAYAQDPLRHRRGTARLVTEFLQTVRWINGNLPALQTPVLILHGAQDKVTPAADSRTLFEQLLVADKTYQEYGEGYHDLHNDLDMSQVVMDISDWLDCHIPGDLSWCKRGDRLIYT